MNGLNPDISIVVPVYNVEKYLFRCLDSIFSQQFSGTYEVIAVEDCSSDKSLQLLRNYQAKQPQLKIIEHGVNKTLAIARRTGMDASSGDYILHVDSDDWLLPDALEKPFKKCLEMNADVLVFNYVIENSEGQRTLVDCIKKEVVTTDKDQVQIQFLKTAWNKLVKRSLTCNLNYGKYSINSTEDLLYASEILLKARVICLMPESYYVYFMNIESITRVNKPHILINNQVNILQQIKTITDKYNATPQFTNTILRYLQKNIYYATAQSVFLQNKVDIKKNELINAFRLFPEMKEKELKKIFYSLNNKYHLLVMVFFSFGFRPVIGIILRSIKLYFCKR